MSNLPTPGIVPVISIAILVILVSWGFHRIGKSAVNGRPNHGVGFRLPSLMRSHTAWRVGHAAALPWLKTSAWVITGLAVASIASSWNAIIYIAALTATVVALLAQVLGASVRAHRAVRRLPDE
jgi:hypothetical protein